MPQQFEIGQGATALELNLLTRLNSYGWLDGAGVTLGGSTSSIECNVEPGTILHDGNVVSVASQTVTIQPGDPQNPRKDLVWVDLEGTAKVRGGIPAEPNPPGESREDCWAPAPPPGNAVDGVPLAEVWVPASASSSGDLDAADIIDRRVDAVNSAASLRELASDPADEDLVTSQLWRNTTANELRAYFSDTDEVHAIDTTLVRSLSGPTEIVIEDFDDDIDANWRGGASSFTYDTPAFEGSASAYWDGGFTRDRSLPGDGLERYPEPGDTIAIASYGLDNDGFAYVGFGKEADDGDEYRLTIIGDGTVDLERVNDDGSSSTLGTISFSHSDSSWFIVEVDYDGGGQGVHPFRVYSTASGSRDTVLAEEPSPTQDTAFRGRGLAIGGGDSSFRLDRLAVTPG